MDVGHSNRAPEVIAGSTTTFNVVEQGQNGAAAESVDIHDFMANFTDPDRERNLLFASKAAVTCETDADKLDDNDPACAFAANIYFPSGSTVLKTRAVAFAWQDPDEEDDAGQQPQYRCDSH